MYSDQVVAKAKVGYSRLDIATSTGRYLLYRSRNLRLLRSLFMYCRRSVKGLEVAKARLAAKPNVDCIHSIV